MGEPNEVHVVMGSGGEYSDKRFWFVRGFLRRTSADLFAAKMNQWCVEHGCHESKPDKFSLWEEEHFFNYDEKDRWPEHLHPPGDPTFQLQYTGTKYGVISMPLTDSGGTDS